MILYDQLEVIPHYEKVKIIQHNYGVRKEITTAPIKVSEAKEIHGVIAVLGSRVVATEIGYSDRPYFEITVR